MTTKTKAKMSDRREHPAAREIDMPPRDYQPSKAELEEDVSINATPEDVASAMAPRRIAQEPKGKGLIR